MLLLLEENAAAIQDHARVALEAFINAPAGDEPTADLLTQRLTVHEQTAWMLRSLLEE